MAVTRDRRTAEWRAIGPCLQAVLDDPRPTEPAELEWTDTGKLMAVDESAHLHFTGYEVHEVPRAA